LEFPDAASRTIPQPGTPADWVKRGPRLAGRQSLLAVAVSWDAHYVAAGGGDQRVHVWDLRTRKYLQVRTQ
jgi:ribosomal RNA-processing protein 9